MKCLICNKETDYQICSICLNTTDIKDIINKLKLNENLEQENYENIILEITKNIQSPLKEYYIIISSFRKYYSVPKDKRDYLIKYAPVCLNSNLIDNNDKKILKTSLLDAYYKNYQYENAEKIANILKEEELDYLSIYTLSEYYIYTRRYQLVKKLLNKTIKIYQNEDIINLLNNKLIECESREKGKENGGKAPYLPAQLENKIKYKEFMHSIGIDLELQKPRSKAPGTISIDDYPQIVELEEPRFKSFVAFDIETTGINHNWDSITELAAIRVVDGKIVETKEFIFQELVHPYRRKIPTNVEELTGITNEMVYNAREIWEVFKDFKEFIKDDILLGYNCITFDSKFLSRAGRLSNIKIENKYFDVMKYVENFKSILSYDNKTLNNIANLLGITNPNAHRALADSITTAKVYLKLLEIDNNL